MNLARVICDISPISTVYSAYVSENIFHDR